MPYPRFTKVIMHHFMSQHKSISKRQGSPYNIVDDDGVWDRLKFINKGEIDQVYGKSIPDTLITNEIKFSEGYNMFISYSTSLIPLKMGRGKGAHKAKATTSKKTTKPKKKQPKRKLVLHDESDQSEDESGKRPTSRNTPRGVVISETLSAPKKKITDSSNERAGITLEVPDEPTGKYAVSDEGAGTLPKVLDESDNDDDEKDESDDDNDDDEEEETDKSTNIEETDDEETDMDNEDQVMGEAEVHDDEEATNEKVELKQADYYTAILASIRSQVPSIVKDYLGSSLPDAFQKVLQSHTKQLKKELSEKRDYKDVIEESVQANVVNEVKKFLPKFLLKAVKEALEKTPPFLGRSSSQGQFAIEAAKSLSELELKNILYDKMHKIQSHLNHDTHQELYDALTRSILLDENTMKEDCNPDKVLKKRDHGDDRDKDSSAGSNQGKKTKKRRFNESESSKKTSTTKESSKGKSLAKTSKFGKSVTAEEPVEDLVFKIASDDVKQTFGDTIDDAG
ncbi:hypothetical protein Tco_1317887 [Tanacetum coccineum]